MKYTFIILFFILNFNQVIGQSNNFNFQKDTIFETSYVYNFFTERNDSVFFFGRTIVIPIDSSLFSGRRFIVEIKNPKKGEMSVYFRNKLLFHYPLKEFKINGIGYCYYQNGNVAVQGNFKNNKLDGLTFVSNETGKIITVLLYKKGKYKKHIFDAYCNNEKGLKKRSRTYKHTNPLTGEYTIKYYR